MKLRLKWCRGRADSGPAEADVVRSTELVSEEGLAILAAFRAAMGKGYRDRKKEAFPFIWDFWEVEKLGTGNSIIPSIGHGEASDQWKA